MYMQCGKFNGSAVINHFVNAYIKYTHMHTPIDTYLKNRTADLKLLKVLGITSGGLFVLMACLPFVYAGGQTSIRYPVFALFL